MIAVIFETAYHVSAVGIVVILSIFTKTFALQVRTMTTNKEKAVTAATVHGKKINKTALL